jgi:hypothetical protein
MKIKLDFVTNSSSTNFIIALPKGSTDTRTFIEALNKRAEKYNLENGWKDDFEPAPLLAPESVRVVEDGSLEIEDYIPFYADADDIPEYLRDLDLSGYGIEGVEILMINRNKTVTKASQS